MGRVAGRLRLMMGRVRGHEAPGGVAGDQGLVRRTAVTSGVNRTPISRAQLRLVRRQGERI